MSCCATNHQANPIPTPAGIFESATIMDSDGASEASTQTGSTASTQLKQIGSIKLMPKDTNWFQVRTLEDIIHSLSPAWSYHFDLSDNLPPSSRSYITYPTQSISSSHSLESLSFGDSSDNTPISNF